MILYMYVYIIYLCIPNICAYNSMLYNLFYKYVLHICECIFLIISLLRVYRLNLKDKVGGIQMDTDGR